MSLLAGIDLGSLYSSIAILNSDANTKEDVPSVIANDDGDHQIPTFYANNGQGDLFGAPARSIGLRKPKNSIRHFHKYVGKTNEDEDLNLKYGVLPKSDSKELHYEIPIAILNDDGDEVDNEIISYSPANITSKYINKLKEWAETNSTEGRILDTVVLAIPAKSSDEYKKSMNEVLSGLGFKSYHLVEEPIAAMLAFDQFVTKSKKTNISLVVDFGAHHLDISLISKSHGVYSIIDTITDSSISGEKVDDALFNYACQQFHRRTKLNVAEERRPKAKLRLACEQTKRALSQSQTAMCSVEALMNGVDFNESIPALRYEMLVQTLINNSISIITGLINKSSLELEDISDIVLIGGSSRIPFFKSSISKAFPQIPIRTNVEPDQAISIGCAIHARNIIKPAFSKAISDGKTHEMMLLQKDIGIKNAKGEVSVLFKKLSGLPAHENVTINISKSLTVNDLYIPLVEKDNNKEEMIAELFLYDAIDEDSKEAGKIVLSFTLTPELVLYVHPRNKSIEEGVTLSLVN